MNRRASFDRALTRHPIARSLALAVLGVALVGAVIMGAVFFAVLIAFFIVGYIVSLVSQLLWTRAAVHVDKTQPVLPDGELIEPDYETVDVAADVARRGPGGPA
jgi:hypothetical protein